MYFLLSKKNIVEVKILYPEGGKRNKGLLQNTPQHKVFDVFCEMKTICIIKFSSIEENLLWKKLT